MNIRQISQTAGIDHCHSSALWTKERRHTPVVRMQRVVAFPCSLFRLRPDAPETRSDQVSAFLVSRSGARLMVRRGLFEILQEFSGDVGGAVLDVVAALFAVPEPGTEGALPKRRAIGRPQSHVGEGP